jgi:hypothetical protein
MSNVMNDKVYFLENYVIAVLTRQFKIMSPIVNFKSPLRFVFFTALWTDFINMIF